MDQGPPSFRFGGHTLECVEHRLLRGPDEVPLRPKTFETLAYLVRHHGHVVTKAELLDAVWTDTHVEEAVLTHCIAEARRALGDDPSAPRFIRTLPKVGYKFVADVEPADATAASEAALSAAPREDALTIAVLPFANLSADRENDYFCDGLSEELINGLTRIPALHVVAHSSSFGFKGRDLDAREIGRQLSVRSILEGSVRKSGDRLRISAQLIDTATGYHRWSEQYDRTLADVFVIQDEIAQAILQALKVRLLPGQSKPAFPPATESMSAYLLYLEGRACWHRRFAGLLDRAMHCFQRAIDADPRFALAYAGLADCYTTLGIWAFQPAHAVLPRAEALARTALEIDPHSPEAHGSMSLVRMFHRWEWEEAERDLARALERAPGSAVLHMWAGHFLSIVGRHDEAIAEMRHARELDPLSPIVGANLGWTLHLAGRTDSAIDELRRTLEVAPGNGLALFYLGCAHAAATRYDEALTSFAQAAEVTGGMPWLAELAGWVHGLNGDRALARAALRDATRRTQKTYVPSSGIAFVHLGLGNTNEALTWLERCVEERDALLPWLAWMPGLEAIRSSPRFQRVLTAIGLGTSRCPGAAVR